uniref:Transmembrane protein n=1 Tax=Glossina brevipalpis TaxID=37001 RepID=A0A1A9W516_9MUSC
MNFNKNSHTLSMNYKEERNAADMHPIERQFQENLFNLCWKTDERVLVVLLLGFFRLYFVLLLLLLLLHGDDVDGDDNSFVAYSIDDGVEIFVTLDTLKFQHNNDRKGGEGERG